MNTVLKKKNDNLKTLRSIFANKRVLSALFLTIFILLLYHLGTMLTLPGVELPEGYQINHSSFTSMLNLLSAGGLDHMSIFAIGLGPYITTQIIIQLLSSDLIKPLSNMAKSGEVGKRKLEIITRLATLPFCLIQSYTTIALLLHSSRDGSSTGIKIFGASELVQLGIDKIFLLMFLLSAGTYIAIFFSDIITKRGIGNGISSLILIGIISNIVPNFNYVYQIIINQLSDQGERFSMFFALILYTAFFVILIVILIWINGSVRKIPVQQIGEGLIKDQKELPFLPIKLISASVIPIIFASSLLTIPGTIAQFFPNNETRWFIEQWLTLDSWVGIALYFLATVLFTFFYSYVQINPELMAENFQKSGRFILGVRMGEDTAKHITKVLNRVNWIGGPMLAAIAILPFILAITTHIPSGMALGGTGIIIMVSASLEFWYALKSTSTTSGYNVVKKSIKNANYVNNNENGKVTQLW